MGALLKETEVAALAGISPRSVRRRAWKLRAQLADQPARNGRRPRLYELESLDPQLQECYAQLSSDLETKSAAPAVDLTLAPPLGSNLNPDDRAEAERRFQILQPLIKPEAHEQLWSENRHRRSRVIESMAMASGVSRRTLYAWSKAWDESGLCGLVRSDREDKGKPKIFNAAALDFILAHAFPRAGSHGELSVREIYRAYSEEQAWRAAHNGKQLSEPQSSKYARFCDAEGHLLPSAQLPTASYETFRRTFNAIPEPVLALARKGEEAFHNYHEILSFRDLSHVKPLEYVVMDHRLLDLWCLVRAGQGWKLIRPWLTGAIDMRTRRWLSWAIVETPSSDSIASVLKRVFLDHGIPMSLYWDNGKDFRHEWFEGRQRKFGGNQRIGEFGPAWQGILGELGVRVTHSIVRRARSKIIEPCFLATANFDKAFPEYAGNSPGARPERLEKMIDQHECWLRGEAGQTPFRTIEQIAGLYGEFLETLNERAHPGSGMEKVVPAGLGWMCPNEAWESLTRDMEIRRASPETIQWGFNKRRSVTIQHGEVCVSFGGQKYHYRLPSQVALIPFDGREAILSYDPFDLGTAALYYRDSFIGLVSNAALRRMGESDFVADEKNRRAVRREVKKFIQAVHTAIPVATLEERAARRMAVRPAQIAAPSQDYAPTSPHIAAAVAAAKEESEFSFAGITAEQIRSTEPAPSRDGSEFEFFKRDDEG